MYPVVVVVLVLRDKRLENLLRFSMLVFRALLICALLLLVVLFTVGDVGLVSFSLLSTLPLLISTQSCIHQSTPASPLGIGEAVAVEVGVVVVVTVVEVVVMGEELKSSSNGLDDLRAVGRGGGEVGMKGFFEREDADTGGT